MLQLTDKARDFAGFVAYKEFLKEQTSMDRIG